jgi:valyl-tRNA synthetase
VGKRLCTKLFNASKFAIGQLRSIDQSLLGPERVSTETDRAFIGELRPVIERATEAFEAFDYAQALMLTEEFFWGTFCDNYLEIAKPRTYEEGLTDGRISAASALRLLHRALVRMLAPYLPYLTEEVWHWCYWSDLDMRDSVHLSPWPSLAEFADVPRPKNPLTHAATVAVLEAVRKAKAEANLSMKAPVKQVVITGKPDALGAVSATLDDVRRMLQIRHIDLKEGAPETGVVAVATAV